MASNPSESNLVRIHSDEPASEEMVRFGFDGYADTLAGLIANKRNSTPLVIGIYGHWGSGKTTLMTAIKTRLDSSEQIAQLAERLKAPKEEIRRCKTIWFQAWKYDQESEILAGLLETIFQAMASDDFFNQAKAAIEKLAKGLNKPKILSFVTKLFETADISDFFGELAYKKQLGFYDTFRVFFEDLIWTYLNWRFKWTQSEKSDDTRGALVIFIDDLDRCPKSRIVKVLETVKLFMDHPGCIFVIGAARDIIVKALTKDYGEQDAHRFMDKIVQVTFNLPKVTESMFQPYLLDLGKAQEQIAAHLTLIMPAMGYNPRQLKRFVNNLNLRHGLMRTSGISIAFDAVLHWGIIEYVFPYFADYIEDNPNNLFTLKRYLGDLGNRLGHTRVWETDDQLLKELNVGQSLHEYIRNERIVSILSSLKIEKEEFGKLLTFSASVEPEETIEVRETLPGTGRRSETMVEIPAGEFKFGDLGPRLYVLEAIGEEIPTGEFKYGDNPCDARIDRPYWIDIYPVTNERFKAFIEHGGYETEKWWTKEGWQWREKNSVLRPEYWDDSRWNAADHPVVGVSWYEAAAFCAWLTEAGKDGFEYHLPGEKQWERAARGTDGRRYPWGPEFDKERCNTRESSQRRTSRVDRYADGVSPTGCYDMAGNVWEWTGDFYGAGKDRYIVKGGSWNYPAERAHCAERSDFHPTYRTRNVGFRCARTLK